MDITSRLGLITRNTEEVLTVDDLKALLELGVKLKHYIGFEISGNLHIGSAFMSMFKVKDFQKAGVDCSVFLADWHSWINNKLGGDWDNINKASKYYEIVFKTVLDSIGGDTDRLKIVKGSELYHNNDEYWRTVVDVSKHTTLSRMLRSITIAGRKEGESINFALLIYPAMQVADIFTQEINLVHAGMDQRKAHVIARDVALKIYKRLEFNRKAYKPVAVHHSLVPGLQKPPGDITNMNSEEKKQLLSELKMSKSIKQSAIFVTDTEKEVVDKINKAFCVAREVDYNPVLEWARLLVLSQKPLKVERPQKFRGDKVFESFEKLKKDFATGSLHPLDLKQALAREINTLLKPVRHALLKHKDLVSFMDKLETTK